MLDHIVANHGLAPEHAYLITQALAERFGLDKATTFEAGLPVHAGSEEFLADCAPDS